MVDRMSAIESNEFSFCNNLGSQPAMCTHARKEIYQIDLAGHEIFSESQLIRCRIQNWNKRLLHLELTAPFNSVKFVHVMAQSVCIFVLLHGHLLC